MKKPPTIPLHCLSVMISQAERQALEQVSLTRDKSKSKLMRWLLQRYLRDSTLAQKGRTP